MRSADVDVAVVGSGFAGSLMAMIARRLGRSVMLLERGTHPRTVIGESSTPLTNLLLEELATRYDLPRLLPFTKWGTWQRNYPEVGCGLKRGFTFYHHDLDRPAIPDREAQMLVAASPHDGIADTHWYRADFDLAFVREAQTLGVEYLDEVNLERATPGNERVELEGERRGERIRVRARFVIDGSSPRGFLHQALGLEEAALPDFPATQAVWAHFTGVGRLSDGALGEGPDEPPYRIDAAAVHHVFAGGWIWVLQFNNGVTSAGVAATDEAFARLGLARGEAGWRDLIQCIPVLKRQFQNARETFPFRHIPRLAFRSGTIARDRWALLPSAAGFVDPLLSTGFPMTLLGIGRLAEALEYCWESPGMVRRLRDYAAETQGDLLAAARLISGLYASMGNAALFSRTSLLYFAAVSFTETARRLGKRHLAGSFLLHADERFGARSAELMARARAGHLSGEEVRRCVEPFNVAGLGNVARRNWYGVAAEDLLRAANKVESNPEEVQAMLERAGFWRSEEYFASSARENFGEPIASSRA